MNNTPQSSSSSGKPILTAEDQSGTLSGDSKAKLREAFNRAKSLQPPDDLPPSIFKKKPNPSSSPMQPHGCSEGVGSPSTTLKPKPQLPATPTSIQNRRQSNLQDGQWRSGFGRLMILASSAFNRKFGVVDLELWSMALAEYSLEDLNEGFAQFIKSPEGFPTPGKAEVFIKKCRQQRLGIVVR